MSDYEPVPNGLGVSDAIEGLRAELEESWRVGEGQPVQFDVDEVSLTLTVVASNKKDIGGKIRWWVVEAGGSGTFDHSETQTLVLKLKPVQVDKDGNRWSMRVAGRQSAPGQ